MREILGVVSDSAVLIAIVVLLLTATVIAWRIRGVRTVSERPLAPVLVGSAEVVGPDDGDSREVFSLLTDRPNEIYLFGSSEELDRYGTTLATTPPQVARHAAQLRSGVDVARSFAEFSGRLVLVDDKTAKALRAGRMMHDKGGEILAHVLDGKGKVSSISRLRQIGGLGASVASITNAMSAMATQAQLDRIESHLAEISQGVEDVHREQLREWDARTVAALEMLREVYDTATRAGELTPANWSQISGLGYELRTQINGDRDRLTSAVARLEALAESKDATQRRKEVEQKVRAVLLAHESLRESSRAWAQFSTLRLWHFTVIDDPSLEGYRQQVHELIDTTHASIEPLHERTERALLRFPQVHWRSRLGSPIDSSRLPGAAGERLLELAGISWLPFELPTPPGESEPTGEIGPAAKHDEGTVEVGDGADS